jgi:anti-sigma regulatory factor (Ser/Thr protein kinase)
VTSLSSFEEQVLGSTARGDKVFLHFILERDRMKMIVEDHGQPPFYLQRSSHLHCLSV